MNYVINKDKYTRARVIYEKENRLAFRLIPSKIIKKELTEDDKCDL